MFTFPTGLVRKLGILSVMILLAFAVVSCSGDDPVSPPDDPPVLLTHMTETSHGPMSTLKGKSIT